jgi:type II secretory pathway pseudopilin PulG
MTMQQTRRTIRRRGKGFTYVEVLIATTIASIASIGLFSVFLMSSRFIAQGFTENRITFNASLAVERISRSLNSAFRLNAVNQANIPSVSGDNQTVTFTMPLAGGGTTQRRFRYNAADDTLRHEVNNGGVWSDVSGRPLLSDVEDFFALMENTEGFITFTITMRARMPLTEDKVFTMVGRALPRNIDA